MLQALVRFSLLVLLLYGSVSLVVAQAPPTDPRAEAVADQIIQTFYKKLDFADVYREWYVKNEKIRQLEIQLMIGNFLKQGDSFAGLAKSPERNIDPATMERAYLAWANFHWNSVIATRSYEGDRASLLKKIEPAFEQYYTPITQKSNWPILTGKELDEGFTLRFNKLADFFRTEVAVKTRLNTAEFREKLSAVVETKEPESLQDLRQVFAPAGVGAADRIFIARRGVFYIYLIEDNGELRMFSFTNRVRD